ncbi:MAG: hypothetical protein KTR15_14970 [Phycisphaeraceae bacterium]|nr:hypothetical protein [Phycisphaeraceae bacterium]
MTDPEDALRDLAAASASGDKPIEPEPMEPTDAADALASSSKPESPIAQEPKPAKRPEAPPTVERDESGLSANALAQLSGTESAAYDPGMHSNSSRRKRRMQKPDTGMIGVRTASIPVLITMGLIMIALGVWGILVKAGNDTLPMADQGNAQQLAIIGLVGLPIGVLLFASAGFMFYMVGKDKAKLARWEALQEEDE